MPVRASCLNNMFALDSQSYSSSGMESSYMIGLTYRSTDMFWAICSPFCYLGLSVGPIQPANISLIEEHIQSTLTHSGCSRPYALECGTLCAVSVCACVCDIWLQSRSFLDQIKLPKTHSFIPLSCTISSCFVTNTRTLFQMLRLQMCWAWKRGSPSLKGLMPIYPIDRCPCVVGC